MLLIILVLHLIYMCVCVCALLYKITLGIYAFDLPFLLSYNQEDDSALLRFLQCKFGKGQENGPEFFYDPKYALRLCLKEKRMRACVHIYSMMSMHEEAVALALQVILMLIILAVQLITIIHVKIM